MSWLPLYQQKRMKSYQSILAKDLKDQCIGTNIKQKMRIKIKQTSYFKYYIYFIKSNFVEVNSLFVLIYPSQNDSIKRFNSKMYYLPKGIIRKYCIIANGKNFYDQPINSDIKLYKEIKNFTTGQGEDYFIGYLLDYEYIKNHHKLNSSWFE